MANLLMEYCKRHKNNFIVPTNEGLLFFNDFNRPAIVALTSITPKATKTCWRCANINSWITLELFSPCRDTGYSLFYHDHIHPDENILDVVKLQYNSNNYEPVIIKNGREIETWLWNFFLFHNRLRKMRAWNDWFEIQPTQKEPLQSYEQMTFCATNFPKTFATFYYMYQTFVAGRKYLAFE